jgi:hypothetical protein
MAVAQFQCRAQIGPHVTVQDGGAAGMLPGIYIWPNGRLAFTAANTAL